MTILYDGDCGFCKVALAVLLRWDRARRLTPAPIQSDCGERLLADMTPEQRLSSWHLIDHDRTIHSGGAGIAFVFAELPGGAPLARLAARFPRATARAYEWVAHHRGLLGRPLGDRSRSWAARVLSERTAAAGPHEG